MKVTVCFGSTRVVVPCGNGELLVNNLIEKSIARYKKAIGKPSDYWVIVHNFKSDGDGGILDPDDILRDVADDREQIIALFEEQEPAYLGSHNGGDGTSGSSAGSPSPEIFRVTDEPSAEFIITQSDLDAGSKLLVRRGSEPALNIPEQPSQKSLPRSMKVWPEVSEDDSEKNVPSAFSKFTRDSTRQSLASNSSSFTRWLDAADGRRLRQSGRKEPLGACQNGNGVEQEQELQESDGCKVIELMRSGAPLGIHVVPSYDETGQKTGLLVQDVEVGGRIHQDGRLQRNDLIVEINGNSLRGIDYDEAQTIFKQALLEKSIQLKVRSFLPSLKAPPISVRPKEPPPVPPQSGTPTILSPKSPIHSVTSDTGKVPPAIPARHPLQTSNKLRLTGSNNTRRIGKTMTIRLCKGAQGLGFSVTTRDNPAGGDSPVYVKNILPKGAALQDGQLRSGDRLLAVNDIKMAGKSQTEAASILRSMPPGTIVSLTVSRHSPTELQSSALPTTEPVPSNVAEVVPLCSQLTQVPIRVMLDGSGTAGLGVSVKGKTSTHHNVSHDLGLFVKSIIEGGAAHKDGQLKVNDRILSVNGKLLESKSNSIAMEHLRQAMQPASGAPPDFIELLVGREDCKLHSKELNNNNIMTSRENNASKLPEQPVMPQIKQVPLREHGHSSSSSLSQRPASTLGLPRSFSTSSDQEQSDLSPDAQTSDVFLREGFGRQSMSEKRRGYLHPAQLEHYQKLRNRQSSDGMKRAGSAESLATNNPLPSQASLAGKAPVGPSLGLKKSSSLESLPHVAGDVVDAVDAGNGSPQETKGRCCNDSFRAAVDHSYEDQSAHMDTLDEESSEGGSFRNAKAAKEKKAGIFKNFFRFGKQRKDDGSSEASTESLSSVPKSSMMASLEQRERMNEFNRKMAEQRQLPVGQGALGPESHMGSESVASCGSILPISHSISPTQMDDDRLGRYASTSASVVSAHGPADAVMNPPKLRQAGRSDAESDAEARMDMASRAERIQKLRVEHQRRHRHRGGQYPLDKEQELAEWQMKMEEKRRNTAVSPRSGPLSYHHEHSASDQISSSRHSQWMDTQGYASDQSHYENAELIRAQFMRHRQLQAQYWNASSGRSLTPSAEMIRSSQHFIHSAQNPSAASLPAAADNRHDYVLGSVSYGSLPRQSHHRHYKGVVSGGAQV